MATNEIFDEGAGLYLPVASGVESGDPCRIGDQGLSGVALTDRDSDGKASVRLIPGAVFDLPIVTAANQLDIGDVVYITTTNTLTRTSGGSNLAFGWALETLATNTAGTIRVKLGR